MEIKIRIAQTDGEEGKGIVWGAYRPTSASDAVDPLMWTSFGAL